MIILAFFLSIERILIRSAECSCPALLNGEYIQSAEIENNKCVSLLKKAYTMKCAKHDMRNWPDCIEKLCSDNFPNGHFWYTEKPANFPRFSATLIDKDNFVIQGYVLMNATDWKSKAYHTERNFYQCKTFAQWCSPKVKNCSSDITYCAVDGTAQPDEQTSKSIFGNLDMYAFKYLEKIICMRARKDNANSPIYFKFESCRHFPKLLVTCGHEKEYACDREQRRGVGYLKKTKKCYEFHYVYTREDRLDIQKCFFKDDYGQERECKFKTDWTDWSAWSQSCGSAIRVRFREYLHSANGDKLICDLQNHEDCHTEKEKKEYPDKCEDYIKGTNISLRTDICAKPGGKKVFTDELHHKCQCDVGYTGLLCNQTIDHCASNPCKNKAKCINEGQMFTCICKDGYTGDYCENVQDLCKLDTACQNGGSCTMVDGNLRCTCAPKFTGKNCETEIKICGPKTCQPHGICENVTRKNTFKCLCFEPYTGILCEEKNDKNEEVEKKPDIIENKLIIYITGAACGLAFIMSVVACMCIRMRRARRRSSTVSMSSSSVFSQVSSRISSTYDKRIKNKKKKK